MVTRDVLAHAMMVGVPAQQVGWVCECGEKLDDTLVCKSCQRRYDSGINGLEER